MKILVIGSGGREHAIAWKISQSPFCEKIFCAPGNGGTAEISKNIPIEADNVGELKKFALRNKIDLTVVGPEIPLVKGIVDEFSSDCLKCFGPSKEAAMIEGSKAFMRNLLSRHGIPSIKSEVFSEPAKAINYVRKNGAPIVVKADGLAAGKGVVVAETESEAIAAIKSFLEEKVFGKACEKILLEEKVSGQEASILAFCDGKTVIPMASSQDHKRIFDNDIGANTGGMGAYSPAPIVSTELMQKIVKKTIQPAIDGLRSDGMSYKGVIYAGVMIENGKFSILEFNARFGDPETQAILPRMKSDLIPIMNSCIDGTLKNQIIEWEENASTCIVLASGGYPGNYEKGKKISGLNEVKKIPNSIVFHAGTKLDGINVLTNGGRVLNVVGFGKTIKESIDTAYKAVEKISFEKMHYRKDIGKKALNLTG